MLRRLVTSGTCLIMLFGLVVPSCEGGGDGDPCSRCPPPSEGKALVNELSPGVKAGLADLGITPTYKGIKQQIGKLYSPKPAVQAKAQDKLAAAWVLVTKEQPGTKLEGLVRDVFDDMGLDVDAIVAQIQSG